MPSAEEWLQARGLSVSQSQAGEETVPPAAGPTADAVRFIQRSVARTPQSSSRIKDKLLARAVPDDVANAAIAHVTATGEIDDSKLAAALVAEWLEKGHAPRRIAHDLKKRGFTDTQIRDALAVHQDTHDPFAAAFAVATQRAAQLLSLPRETALRRLTGHVARRGYSPAVAAKAARDALYAAQAEIDAAEA